MKQKSKVEELAAALNVAAPSGSQTNTRSAINQIIRSWMERDFDEATEEALLLACSQIGIFEEIRARAASKNVELPPLQKVCKRDFRLDLLHISSLYRILKKNRRLLANEAFLRSMRLLLQRSLSKTTNVRSRSQRCLVLNR